MSPESRKLAGILLVVFPTVLYGGLTLLMMLIGHAPGYLDNPLRQNLWRAGHAHAGVLLVLSLVALRYVDETSLMGGWKWLARAGIPCAAILMPLGFFLSVLSPSATTAGPMIYSVYAGGTLLAASLLTLGVGLLRRPPASKG